MKVDEKSYEVKLLQQTLEKKDREQKVIIQEAKDIKEKLEGKMKLEKASKLKAQKKASRLKMKDHTTACKQSEPVQKLSDEIIHLENKNDNLQDQLQQFMEDEQVKSLKEGDTVMKFDKCSTVCLAKMLQ